MPVFRISNGRLRISSFPVPAKSLSCEATVLGAFSPLRDFPLFFSTPVLVAFFPPRAGMLKLLNL